MQIQKLTAMPAPVGQSTWATLTVHVIQIAVHTTVLVRIFTWIQDLVLMHIIMSISATVTAIATVTVTAKDEHENSKKYITMAL
jgi:hypothetical protein